jgi:TRAP-type C4-dicarboxylate transport system permease small subunit
LAEGLEDKVEGFLRERMSQMGKFKMLNHLGLVGKTANNWLAILILAAMVILVTYSVIMRYIFCIAFRWSEELVTILFVFLIFLAIPMVLREKLHICIEFFVSLLPKKAQRVFTVIVDGVILFIAGFITITGFQVMATVGIEPMPATKLPIGILYATAAISGVIMIIDMVVILGRDLYALKNRR